MSEIKFEPDAKYPVLVGGGDDTECADFMCRVDMRSAAGTGVVVADMDDPDGITRIFGKPMQVVLLSGRLAVEKLLPNECVPANHGVHVRLEVLHFLHRKIPVKVIVALGLLLFQMGSKRPGASKRLDHGTVEDVLRGMHPGVDLLFGLIGHGRNIRHWTEKFKNP